MAHIGCRPKHSGNISARAGTDTNWSFGDDESLIENFAWYKGNSGGKTHEVGTKGQNRWGLHDMHGNVWEWVEDIYKQSYEGLPTNGSANEAGDQNFSERRVVRGGSWFNTGEYLNSANRSWLPPIFRVPLYGFRVAYRPAN